MSLNLAAIAKRSAPLLVGAGALAYGLGNSFYTGKLSSFSLSKSKIS